MLNYLRNRQWAITLGLLLFIITLVPYLIGFTLQNEMWRFSGFVFGVEDGNSYLAKMLLGANGEWLFRTPYSAGQQNGILSFLPYIILGKLSSPNAQHEQLLGLFQIFRLIGILCFCLAAYDFFSLFTSRRNHIQWAILLSAVGGGLGWLTVFGLKGSGYNSLPIDLYSPETFGFLSLYGLPHLAVSRALLVWGWVIWIKTSPEDSCWKKGLISGCLWFLMGFFQPLAVITAWVGIAGGWIVLFVQKSIECKRFQNPLIPGSLRRYLINGILAFLISCFWFIYNAILIQIDPFLRSWSSQNIIMSPGILDYLLGFSLIIIPVFIGAFSVFRKKKEEGYLSLGFFLLFPVMAYFPINLQRRLPDGIWWVFISLALLGLEKISRNYRKLFLFTSFLGIFTSIFLLVGGIFSALSISSPTFIQSDYIEAYQSIDNDWGQIERPVVMANFKISNSLPAWVFGAVIIGHGPESVNLEKNRFMVEGLLSTDKISDDQISWMDKNGVDYVILENDHYLEEWKNLGAIIFSTEKIWVVRIGL